MALPLPIRLLYRLANIRFDFIHAKHASKQANNESDAYDMIDMRGNVLHIVVRSLLSTDKIKAREEYIRTGRMGPRTRRTRARGCSSPFDDDGP